MDSSGLAGLIFALTFLAIIQLPVVWMLYSLVLRKDRSLDSAHAAILALAGDSESKVVAIEKLRSVELSGQSASARPVHRRRPEMAQ